MGVERLRLKRHPIKTTVTAPLKNKIANPRSKHRPLGCPLCGGLAWCIRKGLSGCWQCSHCGERGRTCEKCSCRRPFVWYGASALQKKSATRTLTPATLLYWDFIPWQDLSVSERQRFLDRGKLTPRDLSALEELGLDTPPVKKETKSR